MAAGNGSAYFPAPPEPPQVGFPNVQCLWERELEEAICRQTGLGGRVQLTYEFPHYFVTVIWRGHGATVGQIVTPETLRRVGPEFVVHDIVQKLREESTWTSTT